MELCNSCEIVYRSKLCPLCVAQDQIKELEIKIEKLEEELNTKEF